MKSLACGNGDFTPTHSPVLLQPAEPLQQQHSCVPTPDQQTTSSSLLRAGSRILGTGLPILCLSTPILQSTTKMVLCDEDVCPSNASVQFLLKLMVPLVGGHQCWIGVSVGQGLE